MKLEIITLLLRLAIVVITCVIAPTVKHWLETSTENAKMESIREAAWSAVYAAEQLYNTMERADPSGEIRRKYAARAVSIAAARAGIALTDSDIDNIVQAAVQEINLVKHGGLLPKLEGELNES
jgi:uncharacterized membrane protein